jgi:hypothetical protein
MAAVVVYAIRDGYPIFFIGKESRFLRDLIGRETAECHTFDQLVNIETMKCHFTDAAKTQSDKMGFRVQYDTPHQDPVTLVAKTHFRYVPEKGVKYGIVKGGMEIIDDGRTLNTALREFSEECMNLPTKACGFQKSMTHVSTNETALKGRDLYFLDITRDLGAFESTRLSRIADHYGELFDTSMMSLEDVRKIRSKLNFPSRYAIDVFLEEKLLGTRKRHCRTRNTSDQQFPLRTTRGHIVSSFRNSFDGP